MQHNPHRQQAGPQAALQEQPCHLNMRRHMTPVQQLQQQPAFNSTCSTIHIVSRLVRRLLFMSNPAT
jgi:hypothetical protein